jgi:hypothetical protein
MNSAGNITAPIVDAIPSCSVIDKPSTCGAIYYTMIPKNFIRTCGCGCGQPVKLGKRYRYGHYGKNNSFSEIHKTRLKENVWNRNKEPIPEPILCSCGCGQVTNLNRNKYRKYIHGHNQRHNKEFPEEYLKKLSETKMGDLNPSKRIEVREQISKTLKIYYIDKENHPRWCGGISKEPYGVDFSDDLKQAVREYYNYTCQQCYIHESELIVRLSIHHIDYNKRNNVFINLIPLCNSCHTKTNSNREYWKILFIEKVKNYAASNVV